MLYRNIEAYNKRVAMCEQNTKEIYLTLCEETQLRELPSCNCGYWIEIMVHLASTSNPSS